MMALSLLDQLITIFTVTPINKHKISYKWVAPKTEMLQMGCSKNGWRQVSDLSEFQIENITHPLLITDNSSSVSASEFIRAGYELFSDEHKHKLFDGIFVQNQHTRFNPFVMTLDEVISYAKKEKNGIKTSNIVKDA
eukprot:306863_1